MTDTWIPVARRGTPTLAGGGSTSADPQPLGWDGKNVNEGEVCGVSVTVNASNGAGHSVRVQLYSEDALTNLLYDTTIDLSAGTSGTDTLAMPIPLFPTLFTDGNNSTPSSHSYVVTDINGGGGKDYQVFWFVRATT